uniref:Ribosomal protein L5 n=1 Tax=Proteromonas lacertae TaxID=42746 RepID=E2E9Z4_PROLC|nr:ribosomal protein L5 [Proteromonas lacertae]YP_003795233.1 ribosomal protein L5 [Proteromonas lacertae]ADD46349.1 ribosomal protein L5 [Proteromonas lacertae]ADD46371.1 ribosomal protein L5 [Proteromonas lacertae]
MFSRNIYNYYYYNIVQFDLYLKCFCKNYMEIVKLKQIILYFNFKNTNDSISEKKKKLMCIFTSFLITNQFGKFISTQDIQKNKNKTYNLVSYKISLRKNTMFLFISYLFTFLSPNTLNFKYLKNNKNTFTYNLNNLFLFPEIYLNIYNFVLIRNETLNITFVTNSTNSSFLNLLISSFNI